MPVDSAEKRINIKDLVLEQPEMLSVPFDSKKDVTYQDWQAILKEYFGSQSRRLNGPAYRMAASAVLLDPGRISQFKLSEEDFEALKSMSEFKLDFAKPNPAVDCKILFPSKKFELGLPPVEELQGFYGSFGATFTRGDIRFAAEYVILKPELRTRIETAIGDNYWGVVRSVVKEELTEKNTQENILEGPLWVANTRIVSEEKFGSLNLGDDFWIKARMQLDLYRKGKDYMRFIRLASYLAIIAADEIEFTKNGLRLISIKDKGEVDEKLPALPQTRRF